MTINEEVLCQIELELIKLSLLEKRKHCTGWMEENWIACGFKWEVHKEECEMLVLSRKEGEKLVIGDNITLVVSKISGNRVTVGIEAPADVKIFRGELQSSPSCAKPSIVPLRRATLTIDLDERQLAELDKQAM
jgi:carbon storage regulator